MSSADCLLVRAPERLEEMDVCRRQLEIDVASPGLGFRVSPLSCPQASGLWLDALDARGNDALAAVLSDFGAEMLDLRGQKSVTTDFVAAGSEEASRRVRGPCAADRRKNLQRQGGRILAAMEAQPPWKRACQDKTARSGDLGKRGAHRRPVRPTHAANLTPSNASGPPPESLPMNLRILAFSC